MEDERAWMTPTDLAEYEFCPRAHFYRCHGERPRTPSAIAGDAYHRRVLSAQRWRDEHRSAPWLAVAVGSGLVGLALLLLML